MAERTCKTMVRDMRFVTGRRKDHDIELWSDDMLDCPSVVIFRVEVIAGVVTVHHIGGPFLKIWVDPRYPFNEVFKEVGAVASGEGADADSG